MSKLSPATARHDTPAATRWLRAGRHAGLLAGLATVILSCSVDFDASRDVPKRASLGQEVYGIVCDRVGAQALRVDVTGASFHDVCHAGADGTFANEVDRSLLPPLRPSKDIHGKAVPRAKLESDRAYQIGRVEALARRREDLIKALDAALPDIEIVLRKKVPVDPKTGCDDAYETKKRAYLSLLSDTMTRLIDLYNDGTVPSLTRAAGRLMYAVRDDPEASAALARVDARQGYRPLRLALGVSVHSFP